MSAIAAAAFLVAAVAAPAPKKEFEVKEGKPVVCMIYKEQKFTCSDLMLIYNKHKFNKDKTDAVHDQWETGLQEGTELGEEKETY
jgi:hypothetical protein